jgi:CheY-like chemotaxis protein
VISVADQGGGIPEQYLNRIFDPYFTTKPKGSGLGLTTSYSIVKRHDGIITVDSRPREGATFTMYLPASNKPLPKEQRATAAAMRQGKGRILVMDDEEFIREVAGSMLSHLGYKVDFASDGQEAVDRYRRAHAEGIPYDAVIFDLTIPGGMGGKEAMDQLLAVDPGAKGIVSSGYSHGPIMAEYRRHGFRGVVAKPYRLDDLSRVVADVLAGSGQQRQQAVDPQNPQ